VDLPAPAVGADIAWASGMLEGLGDV